MTERRYNQEEVEAIFQRAAEAQQAVPLLKRPDEGMTLGQLQEIGREVGITPEQIGFAAKSIERTGRTTRRTLLGLPIGVGRAVDLDRRLTDSEWERLVVELRDTFDAKGRIKQEGNFRQWSNGNLQVMLEPMGDRHRLRMRTYRAQARTLLAGGTAMIVAALTLFISRASGDHPMDPSKFWTLILLGGTVFGIGAAMIPAWARERQRQMREIAERVSAWAGEPAT